MQADSIVPSPGNPQSLNRYSYCLGNPLRYTDPSGYLTDDQIEKWTGYNIDELPQEIYELLRAMHLYDFLYGHVEGRFSGPSGRVTLDSHNYLQFGGQFSVEDLLNADVSGWLLTRTAVGGTARVAYQSGGNYFDDLFSDPMPSVIYEGDHVVTKGEAFGYQTMGLAWTQFRDTVVSTSIGALAGSPAGLKGIFVGGAIGFGTGFVLGLVDNAKDIIVGPPPGHQAGDRVITYDYQLMDTSSYSSQFWHETMVIRGNQVIEHTCEPSE